MPLSSFPALNASLNAATTVLLILGLFFILRRQITAHRICMGLAVLTSSVFLGCYLYYHFHAGSTRFTGTGWIRPVYFTILLSHTILAVVNLPLIIITVYRALTGQLEKHKALARWTWPIWMYVSVTGVLIYFMLYHWFRV
jgi:putative membrane protein